MCQHIRMRTALVACVFGLGACAQTPPLNIKAVGRGHTCSLIINNVEMATDAMDDGRWRALAAAHKRRTVFDTDGETPYRCIGAVVFNLQRAGFQIVSWTLNGVPILAGERP